MYNFGRIILFNFVTGKIYSSVKYKGITYFKIIITYFVLLNNLIMAISKKYKRYHDIDDSQCLPKFVL